MSDTEKTLRRKKAEHLHRMKEWDDICPDGAFVDADIKENTTGKAARTTYEGLCHRASSLEQ